MGAFAKIEFIFAIYIINMSRKFESLQRTTFLWINVPIIWKRLLAPRLPAAR